ncbi:MAG TPA: HEAT repeat domain-containing protein [Bryobacteraceae bacterium]|jgi:hypothetical protein|nr:HEAT repeat domain-containing protein [Bryobacteraceae bacterium]
MKIVVTAIACAACLSAQQQPQVENAGLESRIFAGSLPAELAGFGAGPFWAAWQEPITPGRRGDMCFGNDNGHASNAPVRLEGPAAVVVLVRIENAQVDQLRSASPDCRFDGGGLPFHWITGVPAEASLAWLKTQVTGKHSDGAILAIGLHAGAAADRVLDELTDPAEPERVRERAAFWLGSTRGAQGVDKLKRMLASDRSESVREQVIFALSQSREPAGIAAVVDAAKNDKDPRVRSRALFWVAQRAASRQAQDTISGAIVNDPDRTVKEQAVFALKQLPEDQGVPLLIDVAKNNADPAVRKKAIFWLGQSKDPRAFDFLAQLLR